LVVLVAVPVLTLAGVIFILILRHLQRQGAQMRG
jgi:hypothetical protein